MPDDGSSSSSTSGSVASGLIGTGASLRAERELTAKADAILDLLGLQGIRDKRVGGQLRPLTRWLSGHRVSLHDDTADAGPGAVEGSSVRA
jgi:hypothetical protein